MGCKKRLQCPTELWASNIVMSKLPLTNIHIVVGPSEENTDPIT